MSKEHVWVSRSMMDSRLIKSFTNPFLESDRKKLIVAGDANNAGKPLTEDYFPSEVYQMAPGRKPKKLPDFCMADGYVVSEPVAEIFRRFDMGQGALYPVRVLQYDRKTPLEGSYFFLNFGNSKTAFLPEMSESIKRNPYDNSDIWKLRANCKSGDVAVSANALNGPDIWIDTRLTTAFFLSDRLVQALKAAKLTRYFGLLECRVVPLH